jgi:hypothetical protein
MYNLLVSGNPEAWEGTAFDVPAGRVLREFTDDYLTARFAALDQNAIGQLMLFPALLCCERNVARPARIGWLRRIAPRGSAARVQYRLEARVPPIDMHQLIAAGAELDVTDWEMNRTHWALKDVDLFDALCRAGLIDPAFVAGHLAGRELPVAELAETLPEIEARPTIFRIPETRQEADLVSVMMPFRTELAEVFQAISRACSDAGLRCRRADDIWEEDEVIQEIFSLIYHSTIVVCDFTGQNPNVFYEAGIAHTLGRPVVPITQNAQDIPFDIQHRRFLTYSNNADGHADLRNRLAARLKTLVRRGQR